LQNGLRAGIRDLLRAAHSHGLSTSLDPGYDPAETWDPSLIGVLEEVDVFLPNESEIQAITRKQDIADGLRALQNGRTLTIAKLGRDGTMTLDGGAPLHVPGIVVETVDTTGAGDSFNAGFLHAWLRRYPVPEALRFACACGAISTLGMGGTGAQATESQAQEFLRQNERICQ
jgi:sugar/nucleoside kinase (ribokinase family)